MSLKSRTYYLTQIMKFRYATGLPVGSGEDCDHDLHLRLMDEELSEFLEAKTLAEQADALADTLVVAGGYHLDGTPEHSFDETLKMLSRLADDNDIDLRSAFDIVHISNMSKVCTKDQIEPTREKYQSMNVSVEFRETIDNLYGCFCRIDNRDLPEIEKLPPGKLLKGVGYREPDWSNEALWKIA